MHNSNVYFVIGFITQPFFTQNTKKGVSFRNTLFFRGRNLPVVVPYSLHKCAYCYYKKYLKRQHKRRHMSITRNWEHFL
jgi:hypothetical protein